MKAKTDPVPLLQLKRSLSKTYGSPPHSSFRVRVTQHIEALSTVKGLYQSQILHDSRDLTEYLQPMTGETLQRGVVLKDKYLVLEQLSANTWKLLHLEWKRTVIAKRVDSAILKDSDLLATWATWCTLPQHINVAEAFYLEELEQEQQFLLEEFLNPCSLQQVLREHHFEGQNLEEILCVVGLDIASALNHAHRHGLLHLNLQLSNVLLFSAGKGFALTDFGNPIPLSKIRSVWSPSRDLIFNQVGKSWPSELVNLYSKAKRTRSRKEYQELLELYALLADAKADIFSYGVMLLSVICQGQTWTSTASLYPEVVEEQISESQLPEESKDKFARLIKRAMYDVEETGVPQYQHMSEVLSDLLQILAVSHPDLSSRRPVLPSEECAINKRALLLFTLEAWEDAMHLWSQTPSSQSPEWRFNLYVSHWVFGSVTDFEVLENLKTASEMQLVRIHMMRQDWEEAGKHILFDSCQNDLYYGLLRDAREIYWNKKALKPFFLYKNKHEKTVRDISIIAKGRYVVARFKTGGAVIIDPETFSIKEELTEVSCTCIAGCWTRPMVAVGRETGDIAIYDLLRNKKVESAREHSGSVKIIRLTVDGGKVLSAAEERVVLLWETGHAIILHKIWFESIPSAIAIDGSGNRAAVALTQKTYVRVVDIKREYVTDLCLLQGHKLEVTTLAMAFDGAICVTAGLDAKIMFWEVENKLPFLTIRYDESITSLRATPALEFLVVCLKSGKCCVLESRTSVTWRTIPCATDLGFNLYLTDYQTPKKSIEGFPILKCETEMQLKQVRFHVVETRGIEDKD